MTNNQPGPHVIGQAMHGAQAGDTKGRETVCVLFATHDGTEAVLGVPRTLIDAFRAYAQEIELMPVAICTGLEVLHDGLATSFREFLVQDQRVYRNAIVPPVVGTSYITPDKQEAEINYERVCWLLDSLSVWERGGA